jgi:Protein of unknown function (DUF1360)
LKKKGKIDQLIGQGGIMRFYWLMIGVLSVWRITHLLNAEDGPGHIFVRIRKAVGNGFWGSLLDCFYCLSLWIAAPLAMFIGDGVKERCFLWLAFSGGAILLERGTSNALPIPTYIEHGGSDDAMLRTSKSSGAGNDLTSEG